VRRAIETGEVRPGEQLPPARELASVLGVNMHTVLRAYSMLRDAGLIQLRRARGAVVVDPVPTPPRLNALVTALLEEAERCGISQAQAAALVAQAG
jgi:GntR family transcriptional regulator